MVNYLEVIVFTNKDTEIWPKTPTSPSLCHAGGESTLKEQNDGGAVQW